MLPLVSPCRASRPKQTVWTQGARSVFRCQDMREKAWHLPADACGFVRHSTIIVCPASLHFHLWNLVQVLAILLATLLPAV